MTARPGLVATALAVVFCLLLTPLAGVAAPVLRSADIAITITSPLTCEVTMALTIDGAPEVEHRVEAFDGGDVELIATPGARPMGEPRRVGSTQSLMLRPEQPAYTLHYRVTQPERRAERCPMWLPTVPTDGRTRGVRLRVDLPASTTPGGSMPPFTWDGTRGTTMLGHIPAFVRVPYGDPHRSLGGGGWDIGAVMDAAAIVVFVAASGIWAWRRKRV